MGRFASVYARHREALGCALDAEHATWAAWEPFERGAMLWLEETREIWVLEDDEDASTGRMLKLKPKH